MGNKALSGAQAIVYKGSRATKVTTGNLTAKSWYEVIKVGDNTNLSIPHIGGVFRTPITSTIALVTGDEVYPLTLDRIAKTDCEYTVEEGVIDVTDDSESGYTSNILDGWKNISGSLGGFAKFDEDTRSLETNAASIFSRFFNSVSDNSTGTYTLTPAKNEKLLLFILLDKGAVVGQVQSWIIVPAYITSMGGGAGLKDAQKRDLSWVKAPGYVSLYKRTVGQGDAIGG